MGHPNPRATLKLADTLGHPVERRSYKEDLEILRQVEHCNIWKMTHQRKGKFKNAKEREEHREKEPGKSLHIDMVVIKISSIYRRYRYLVLMTDEGTDYTWAILLKKKSEYSKKIIGVLTTIKER